MNRYYWTPPAPAAPAVQPLSEERIDELWAECMDRYPSTLTIINLARAIEAHHGIAAPGSKP